MNSLRNCVKSSFWVRSILSTRKISSSGAMFKDVPGYEDLIHPEGNEPGIPKYVEKEGENIEQKKSRLIYQSRKRGMLENGLLLSTFAKKYIDKFTEDQLKQYDRLINLPSNDWDIFYWAAEVKPTPQEFDNEIMNLLKKHVRNENKETRYRQPDLY